MARPATAADEVHFVATADGWRLALHRHRPRTSGPGMPVILCGGYGCNRHFIDYDERYSLARFLARHGFDAWVIELRGRGLSYPMRSCARPGVWTFDDLVTMDVPAGVAYVAERTGRPVAWVGHSMGGMALYAYLGCHPSADTMVAAGITIASPVVFPPVSSKLLGRIGHLLLGVPFSDTVPQRWVLGALWHVVGQSDALRIGMNPDNVDRQDVGRALRRSLSDVSRMKLRQLAHWALEGEFTSVDRRIDYRATLARIITPLLVVAGTVDQLATPFTVQRALEHLPTASASYLEFGRGHGHAIDYGHVDLILGRAAPAEVFPAVTSWLAEHTAGR
jgi:predicted alpha/beta hydrolase